MTSPSEPDRLEELFLRQKELNEYIVKKRGLESVTDEEWLPKTVLAAMVELAEVAEEVNYKWWKNPKEIDKAALTEELADVLHFYLSLCLRAGITTDDLYSAYMAKNEKNRERQDNNY